MRSNQASLFVALALSEAKNMPPLSLKYFASHAMTSARVSMLNSFRMALNTRYPKRLGPRRIIAGSLDHRRTGVRVAATKRLPVVDYCRPFREQHGLPEKETLLSYSPEEAAQLLIRFFPKDRASFVPADTVRQLIDNGYGRSEDLDRVLMEGVAYLDRYGLLVGEFRAYSGSAMGRMLSRQGIEFAKADAKLTEFFTNIKDPRSLLHPDVVAH